MCIFYWGMYLWQRADFERKLFSLYIRACLSHSVPGHVRLIKYKYKHKYKIYL